MIFHFYSCIKWFRPHWAGGCYQTGYMKCVKLTFVQTSTCPNGPLKGGVWFPVSDTVHGQDVQVFLSGVLVASIKSHFAPWAWGGVFTFHGYKNEVLFRKFRIAPQTYITKRCKKVVRNIYDTKAVLDASQWHNKKLVSSTTLCDKDSKTTWREVCKFIKEESRFLEPSFFWNFAIIWTKLNLQITSLHKSKPVISPADFANLQIVRTNFLFPRWFEK